MTDFAARRTMMVDTQVRPSDVTKFPIIDAMLSVPREDFVPAGRVEAAYMGENLALGEGRVVLEPRTFGKMLDAVNVGGNEMVLDIGCALGYSAAVIGRMAEAVIAVEEEGMASEAESNLADAGADNVAVVTGALTGGAPRHGPYDVILIQGGVEQVPQAILDQLRDGGRIAALFMDGELGEVRVGYKLDGNVNWRRAFNAFAPVLPGFRREAAFTL